MKDKHPDWIQHQKIKEEDRKNFFSTLDDAKKIHIAHEWIKEIITQESNVYEKQLSDCMHHPDLGWDMILKVFESTENKLCLSRLGAWHIENWLAMHGEVVIDRVEKMATDNIMFQRLLSCVYKNIMPDLVYSKVKDLALSDGYFNE